MTLSLFRPLLSVFLLPAAFLSGLAALAPNATSSALGSFEMPRAGAPRVLRLIDAAGKPLQGSFSQAKWETRGQGLFFTREWAGTRNIWRAFLDPQDSNRYPTWRALPITGFQAPLFASSAAPLPGDGALLMVSNATNPARPAQIVRFDLTSQSLRAVSDARLFAAGAFDPAPSPDGSAMAFAASADNVTSVYTQNFGSTAPRRAAFNARRPAWQNGATLLVESVANNGVFRVRLNDFLKDSIAKGTEAGAEASATRGGELLALVAAPREPGRESGPNRVSSIYVLAGDDSGLRSLAGTQGARGPALSPTGRALCFDAPLSAASSPGLLPTRVLWILNFEREEAIPRADETQLASRRRVVDNPQSAETPQTLENARLTQNQRRVEAPLGQITGIRRNPDGTIAVLGIARGEGASASLEIGVGVAPERWTAFPVSVGLAPSQPLLLWRPPAPRGVWTLRLNISNPSGAAQSQFQVRLPLDATIPPPVFTLPNPVLPSGGLLPRAPLPNLPAPPVLPELPQPAPAAFPTTRPATTRPATTRPATTRPATTRPATTRPATTRPTPTLAPSTGGALPTFPQPLPAPSNFPPLGSAYVPVLPQQPRLQTPSATPSNPAPTPSPSISPPPAASQGARDEASFNISGTLAAMKAGQSTRVTFWALNKGNRAWNGANSRQSSGAVRLVARWVDESSGTRRKWTMQWMKTSVAPGNRTSWSFDLVAPPQPGRYKLIYGLLRVPEEGFSPPAYNAPQESWPHEFAAIAFAVTVKP